MKLLMVLLILQCIAAIFLRNLTRVFGRLFIFLQIKKNQEWINHPVLVEIRKTIYYAIIQLHIVVSVSSIIIFINSLEYKWL